MDNRLDNEKVLRCQRNRFVPEFSFYSFFRFCKHADFTSRTFYRFRRKECV